LLPQHRTSVPTPIAQNLVKFWNAAASQTAAAEAARIGGEGHLRRLRPVAGGEGLFPERLRPGDLAELGELARRHDLWILCDEVYEDLVFAGTAFASPLSDPALAERVIVASSISKSHAAPGFRSGWCVGPAEFCARLLPLSETMLFGNQPFIADMTAAAVSAPSPVAAGMVARFKLRAEMLHARLDGVHGLRVHRPEAGMFALIDVRATGMSGRAFAFDLLERSNVAVMPGESFGQALAGWVRVGLTQPDAQIAVAIGRIADHLAMLGSVAA